MPSATNNVVATKPPQQEQRQCHHIWVVTGPAGSGKSTLAKSLKTKLSWPYIEGDEFHPASNVDKMRNGIPLNDADRWDWLTVLREESLRRLNDGAEGVIVTCSALKKKYRDVIRVATYYDASLVIHFIYLEVPEAEVLERVTKRQNHYMGADMVHSQFEVLERPAADETDSFIIDASRPTEVVLEDAMKRVHAARGE